MEARLVSLNLNLIFRTYKASLQKSELEINEIKNCSFTPRISNLSRSFYKASGSDDLNDDFYTKNISWKMEVEKFKQDQSVRILNINN